VICERFKQNFNDLEKNDFLEMVFKDLGVNFKDEVSFKDKPMNNFNEKMNNDIFKIIFSKRQKE
jgi:hypothetical protein